MIGNCSNCENLEERMGLVDMVLISQGVPREPRYNKFCTLSNSQIKNENVDTQNCVNFKRKYGVAPIKQNLAVSQFRFVNIELLICTILCRAQEASFQ